MQDFYIKYLFILLLCQGSSVNSSIYIFIFNICEEVYKNETIVLMQPAGYVLFDSPNTSYNTSRTRLRICGCGSACKSAGAR